MSLLAMVYRRRCCTRPGHDATQVQRDNGQFRHYSPTLWLREPGLSLTRRLSFARRVSGSTGRSLLDGVSNLCGLGRLLPALQSLRWSLRGPPFCASPGGQTGSCSCSYLYRYRLPGSRVTLAPGSPPTFTVVTVVTSVLIALGIRPAFNGHIETKGWRGGGTKTIKDIRTLNRYLLARRGCGLLGVIGFLFMFQPGFAYSNLAIILVWIAIWIPPGRRVIRYEFSGEVRADSQTTFRFITEPANWSRYSPTEFVGGDPEGPIAAGTVITIRTLVSSTGESADGHWVVGRSKITAMTGTTFTRESLEHHANVVSEVRSIGSAAIVTQRGEWILALTDAILGLTFEYRPQIETAQESFRRGIDLMNEVIGTPMSPAT